MLVAKSNLRKADDVRYAADVAEEVLSRAKRRGHFGTELPSCMIDAEKYEYLNVTTGCSAATDIGGNATSGAKKKNSNMAVALVSGTAWRRPAA